MHVHQGRPLPSAPFVLQRGAMPAYCSMTEILSLARLLAASFGGSALALAIGGYLAKRLFENRLGKDLESFKHSLRQAADERTETLKAALQIGTRERDITMSWLHQKRVETIAALYPRVVELRKSARGLLEFWGPRHPAAIRSGAAALDGQIKELYAEFAKGRIFLSTSVCLHVEKVLHSLEYPIASYLCVLGVYDDHELTRHTMADRDEAWETIQREFPIALSALEAAFRRLLGVRDDDDAPVEQGTGPATATSDASD